MSKPLILTFGNTFPNLHLPHLKFGVNPKFDHTPPPPCVYY